MKDNVEKNKNSVFNFSFLILYTCYNKNIFQKHTFFLPLLPIPKRMKVKFKHVNYTATDCDVTKRKPSYVCKYFQESTYRLGKILRCRNEID